MDFHLPGEVLVMDANGNFHIRNDSQDKLAYHRALFLEDESAEVGKKRVDKDKENGFSEGGGGGLPGN